MSKHILRRLARRLVPPEVIDRRKQGFAIPISKWFNREWMARADELVTGERAAFAGNLRPPLRPTPVEGTPAGAPGP